MNTIEQLVKDLPSDPGMAALEFADRVYIRVIRDKNLVASPNDIVAITTFIRRFCEKYSISANLSKLSRKDYTSDFGYMESHIDNVRAQRASIISSAVDGVVADLIGKYDSNTSANSFGLARLNAEEKKKIHEHIGRIRKILEDSGLSDRKKNALFDRLNDLAREVDALGTLTDRFFAFAGDVGFVMGDMASKAKPLLAEVKEILRIVSRSRARQEGISLPPGDEIIRLAPPEEDQIEQ